MSPRIRPSSALHLLASLPHQLGYAPRDSLVLVPISGSETRGILRIDLPTGSAMAEVAATAVGYACRVPDIEDLIVIVYTDGPVLDGAGVAHEALVSIIDDRASACGLRVTGELCVGIDGWAYFDDATLRSLSEIDDADPDGAAPVASSQTDGVAIDRDDAGASRVATRIRSLARTPGDAFRRLQDADPPATGKRAIDAALAPFDADPHAFFETALEEPRELSPDLAAVWLWILRSPALRDVVLTQWAGGVDEARRTCEWQASWLADRSETPDFPVRIAGEGSRPNADRLIAARAFVRILAARAAGSYLATCLAVCGWLSWALGNSTHAAEYARRALEVDDSVSFASLIGSLTDEGMLPGWSYDPSGSAIVPPWLLAQPAGAR